MSVELYDQVRFLKDVGLANANGRLLPGVPTVKAKTANYTINPNVDAPGTIFTNAGASGAVGFTLPAPGAGVEGFVYDFVGVVDQNITVIAPTVDTLITLHDAAADSLAASTSSQKIGAYLRAICVKTGDTTWQWVAVTLANGVTGTAAS